MPHQIPYRGYNIKTERRDLCWTFTVERTRPELPVLKDQPFRTLTQSERLAVAQARQKVGPRIGRLEVSAGDRRWIREWGKK